MKLTVIRRICKKFLKAGCTHCPGYHEERCMFGRKPTNWTDAEISHYIRTMEGNKNESNGKTRVYKETPITPKAPQSKSGRI